MDLKLEGKSVFKDISLSIDYEHLYTEIPWYGQCELFKLFNKKNCGKGGSGRISEQVDGGSSWVGMGGGWGEGEGGSDITVKCSFLWLS